MNDVPDLKRCEKLCDAGFPQDKSILIHVYLDYVDAFVLDTRKSYKIKNLEQRNGLWFAAPIVTELVEEIKKLLAVPTGDAEGDSMLIAHFFEHSCSVYVPTQTLRRIANHADTLPNALADLWLWLKGRGGFARRKREA